jgi:hypothetical protein
MSETTAFFWLVCWILSFLAISLVAYWAGYAKGYKLAKLEYDVAELISDLIKQVFK